LENQDWLKSDKNTGHLSEDLSIFTTVTLWIHPGWKIIKAISCTQNQDAHFTPNTFLCFEYLGIYITNTKKCGTDKHNTEQRIFDFHVRYLKQRFKEYYLGLNAFYQMKLGGREAF
jgi:hypothetical protein